MGLIERGVARALPGALAVPLRLAELFRLDLEVTESPDTDGLALLADLERRAPIDSEDVLRTVCKSPRDRRARHRTGWANLRGNNFELGAVKEPHRDTGRQGDT